MRENSVAAARPRGPSPVFITVRRRRPKRLSTQTILHHYNTYKTTAWGLTPAVVIVMVPLLFYYYVDYSCYAVYTHNLPLTHVYAGIHVLPKPEVDQTKAESAWFTDHH